MQFRRNVLGVRRSHGAAGRYPVYEKFPCELCGRVEEHRHTREESDAFAKKQKRKLAPGNLFA